MLPVSLRVIMFGPSEGFQAYAWPDKTRFEDNSLALSSSKFELAEKGSAHQITRARMSDGSVRVRFAYYRQAYEPRMQRRGHSFGAAIEVHGFSRDLNLVVSILGALVADLEQGCVADGHFCGPEAFKKFVSDTLTENFAHIDAQLKQGEELHCFKPESQRGLCVEVDGAAPLSNQVAEWWDWFLTSPGGMFAAPSLLTATAAAGRFGPDLAPIGNQEEMHRAAVRKLASGDRELRRERDRAVGQANLLRKTVDELKALPPPPPPVSILVESDFTKFSAIVRSQGNAISDETAGALRKDLGTVLSGLTEVVSAMRKESDHRNPIPVMPISARGALQKRIGILLAVVLVFLIGVTGGWAASAKQPGLVASIFGPTRHDYFHIDYKAQGGGKGTVSISPSSVSCQSACWARFASGTEVTLAATAANGATFVSWSGARCSHVSKETCKITMSADMSVTANFKENPTLKVEVVRVAKGGGPNPKGSVAVDVGTQVKDCNDECSFTVPPDTLVKIAARPDEASTTVEWTGCTLTDQVCQIAMSEARNVTVTFKRK